MIETYVDTVIPPATSVNSDGTTVTATGDAEASVKISSAFNQHGEPGLLIEVSGGDVTIDMSEWPSQQSALDAPLTTPTCPDATDPSYPVKYSCTTFRARFADIVVWVPFTLIPVDIVGGARVPGDGSTLSEGLSEDLLRSYFVREIDAAKLKSGCEVYVSCSGDPVLLVHGYQKEPYGPRLSDNGGRDYWGSFPERLMADGYVPYEFTWLTNARFEDVAADLKQAVELIKTETGHDVHIVAHSFGGVLTRRLLQDPSFAGVASSIASVTTIGTPHLGIFDDATTYDDGENEVRKFPGGQDSRLFGGCGQISCHVMGENAFGSIIASLLDFEETPGSEVYFVTSTIGNLPALNIQSLIGFLRNHLAQNHTLGGDGLISGEGQRFHPELVLTVAGQAKWDGTLYESVMGAALVSEFFLGRDATSDADPFLEPNSIAVPADFIAYRHSSGTPVGQAQYEFSEPLVPSPGFNDVYQRVLDSLGGSIVPVTPTAPLNDTGIDWGGNYPLGNNATCTGETIAGQDCSHGRDATHDDDSDGHAGFSFTKLDVSGNALPASASVWYCVRDEVTGLTWEGKTDDGGLRDTDNTYTWYNPDSSTNGGNAGTQNGGACTGSNCDTYSYVQAVNAGAEALCGVRDWRMPWKEELRSIVDYSRLNPAIDAGYFQFQRSSYVWSGSPYAGQSAYAWIVYFSHGFDAGDNRGSGNRVRLVRSGQ